MPGGVCGRAAWRRKVSAESKQAEEAETSFFVCFGHGGIDGKK